MQHHNSQIVVLSVGSLGHEIIHQGLDDKNDVFQFLFQTIRTEG